MTSTQPSTAVAQNERGRSRKKKKCQRESSSSSEESLERESSHWRGYTQRDRNRSSQPPKMPVFTGKSDLSWESFIYQFERTASRWNWDDKRKACRLLDCLSDAALEYARRVNTREGYETLRKLLKGCFSKKEVASSARRQLQFVRQGDTESLEEFAERVQFLTMDGFHHNTSNIMDQICTEECLRGCREKEAARYIIERNPKSINEVLK